MTSKQHQFILDCVIRKMRKLAFEPVCFEGKSTIVDSLKIPPKIIRHRPDIVGINISNKICIGEAKTSNDLQSRRTQEQIVDYNQSNCVTIFGCPKSSYLELNKLINKLAPKPDNISILKIPDELMPDDEI